MVFSSYSLEILNPSTYRAAGFLISGGNPQSSGKDFDRSKRRRLTRQVCDICVRGAHHRRTVPILWKGSKGGKGTGILWKFPIAFLGDVGDSGSLYALLGNL